MFGGKLEQEKLDEISKKNVNAAGPRYTPTVDPDAPNLSIATLVSAIEALALSKPYKDSLLDKANALSKAWQDESGVYCKLFGTRNQCFKKVIALTEKLHREEAGASAETLRELKTTATAVGKAFSKKQGELWKEQESTAQYSEERRAIESTLSDLRKLQTALAGVIEFVHSSDYSLVAKNCLFIRGEWGVGKTHFLCDVVLKRIALKLPSVFFLAHHLEGDIKLEESVTKGVGVNGGLSRLLNDLNELGKASGGRTLLVIDGINEGDRRMWKRGIFDLAREVGKYSNVGLILSCRSPFDTQILNKRSEKKFVVVAHRGFEEIEFDAQREFFSHYGIPTPHVPLLTPEFSRPLFLKMLCHTLAGKTVTTKQRKMMRIASGQDGMTKILEDFIDDVGEKIEDDFSLPRGTCWNILKGTSLSGSESEIGIAPIMASELRDYVTPTEYESIARSHTDLTRTRELRSFCRRLVTDGLLAEDGIWESGKWISVIRLPYQRFSDHLICRYLSKKSLNKKSEITIKRSFNSDRPFGKIFEVDQWGRSYKMPGLASAVMLNFPQWVKRASPNQRELVYFLPKKNRLTTPFVDCFLEGLLWREHDSFSSRTDEALSFLLENGSSETQRKVLDTLICLATRPGHPHSAERLGQYLLPMSMSERDLFWSEFLRKTYKESTVYRVLFWIENSGKKEANLDVAENLLRLCSLFLTTTDRPLRDRATKAIVFIGENNPEQLFKVAVESFEMNDPYVRERMLAACYGVLMRNWAFPNTATKRASGEFAKKVYNLLFAEDAPHATKHILIQDYALGIIELARKIDPACISRKYLSRLRRPFGHPNAIPDGESITDSACEQAKGAIRMDFENYTVGGLIAGRQNYDSHHEEYRNVLRQIKWRILDLGYSEEKFKDIDSAIGRESFYREQRGPEAGKVDRYGKKYSWVSYFEVCGMRANEGKLGDLDNYPRVAECDIDPSFTVRQPSWTPYLKPIFEAPFISIKDWVRNGPTPSYEHLLNSDEIDSHAGPWVLLNGFIQETAQGDPRQIFSFIRGLLVKKELIPELIKRLEARDYPGNHAIPEPGSDYYTFAGEIPWSKHFGMPRAKSGRGLPKTGSAFEIGIQKTVRVRFDKLSEWEKYQYLGHSSKIKTILDATEQESSNAAPPSAPEEVTLNKPVPSHVTVERYIRKPGIKVEVPIHRYAWESHHSTENQSGVADYVAPSICDHLSLRNRGDSMDLYDTSGHPASLFRMFGEQEYQKSDLIYLRRDLLEKYLTDTNQEIVWIIWGEREPRRSEFDAYREEVHEIWSSHDHIHKKYKVGIPDSDGYDPA